MENTKDIADAEFTEIPKQPSLDELKSQYLNLCSQLGEKQLHIALMGEECQELGERLKKIAKEIFPLLQQQQTQQQPVKEELNG